MLGPLGPRLLRGGRQGLPQLRSRAARSAFAPSPERFDVAVVGGGSAGTTVLNVLRHQVPYLSMALIDPSDTHTYQPGWTLVGSDDMRADSTSRPMHSVLPDGVSWIRRPVERFEPEKDTLHLGPSPVTTASGLAADGPKSVEYRRLIVCPGLELDWGAIQGLEATLGRNGVTSNYHPKHCEYTAQLVRSMPPGGRAVFTQPAMPIKCVGAPQKALYLSASTWERRGDVSYLSIHFYSAASTLFGVPAYVPALSSYMSRYGAKVHFQHRLESVDGPGRVATFVRNDDSRVQVGFDMLHVVPPQRAPRCVRESALADETGFVEVNTETLRHARFKNVYALGDVISSSNSKTVAAVRKQVPVLVHNMLEDMEEAVGPRTVAMYDGYGACPLTVERGKVVLAEFGWDGKLLPTYPRWLIDGTQPSRLAWFINARLMPWYYWHIMLPGREATHPRSKPMVVPAEQSETNESPGAKRL